MDEAAVLVTAAPSSEDTAQSPWLTVDPYANSVAVTRLRDRTERNAPLHIAFLDIDSTLTGNRGMADAVRIMLDDAGYVVVFNTSRTEEMVMTRRSYERSARHIQRPPPHLGGEEGRRTVVPPEQHEPEGILDGDVIAGSSGTRILVRQTDGTYLPDTSYEARTGQPSGEWRADVLKLLDSIRTRGFVARFASIESEENYHAGISDVFPPLYRIQLNFQAVADKVAFVDRLRRARWEAPHPGESRPDIARRIRVIDDSRLEPGGYKLFITPRKASKVHATERIVASLCTSAGIARDTLHLFFAGDSFPDLAMGLLGGLGTDATFLLAGGSRLPRSLIEEDMHDFASEPLGAMYRRLSPTDQPGYYTFRMPIKNCGTRTLIVGDNAFPTTEAVETVYTYLLGNLPAGHRSSVSDLHAPE